MAELSGVEIVGIILLSTGGLVLLWRILHMLFRGEFWNNIPNAFHCGYMCFFLAGVVILTAFISTFTTCPNGCDKVNKSSNLVSNLIVAAIMIAVGVCVIKSCCLDDPNHEATEPLYSWGDPEHGDYGYDKRYPRSGIDLVLILAGLAVLSVDSAMRVCPASCAEAVVGI